MKDNFNFAMCSGITCDPATLEVKFRNGVGSIRVVGNSPSIGG